jgi:hypothetical protein
MAKLEIRYEDGIHNLRGRIDEHADFAPLLQSQDSPLRIGLEDVDTLNSVGTKAFAAFNKALGAREVEYTKAPVFLVDMINTLPALFGRKAAGIKSVLAPYQCTACNHRAAREVQVDEVKQSNYGTEAPGRTCNRCGKPMRLTTDPEEYFLFLTYL